jgi:colicin import membrane protein
MSFLRHPARSLLLALLPLAAAAQDAREIAAERQRIQDERSRIEAAFLDEQKDCYQRFAVTGCIQAARARRREVMSDLRRQEIGLNDLERKQRTAERLRELEDKEVQQRRELEERRAKGQEEQAARDQREAEKAQKATQAASAAQARAAARAGKQPAPKQAIDGPANQQRYEQRMEEAREHRAKVEQRAAQSGKAPRPLPVPP